MAQARKSTSKTKTVPAKKPATKPKGTSVKPKATKTASAKPVKKTKSTSKIVFIVLMVLLGVALIGGVAVCVISKCLDSSVIIENGNGDKVKAKRVSVEDYKYSVVVPTSFKRLSDDEIKSDYGISGSAPAAVYSNEADTANIAFMKPTSTLPNEDVTEYLDALKIILDASMTVTNTETFDVDGHTVGMISLSVGQGDQKVYMQMIFFSYEDQLAIVSFNYKDEARAEWEKVGEAIVRSIEFK